MGDRDFPPMQVNIESEKTEHDGFFKINSLSFTHELYDGTMSVQTEREIFLRGDSVAVLLYKTDSEEIVLTRQFRLPTLEYRKDGDEYVFENDGQLTETVAGMLKNGESPIDRAIEEVHQETGYIVEKLKSLAQFYVSPGGTSEKIFLYYAEITDANRAPESDQIVAGVKKDHENILVRHIPVGDFVGGMFDANEIIDSKLLIAYLLFCKSRCVGQAKKDDANTPQKKSPKAAHETIRYRLLNDPGRTIGVKTGDILEVNDVDVWVNSENTDMEMDRYIGKTVSANIRYGGAAKNGKGQVIEDTIALALRNAMGSRRSSNIGTVHSTTPGSLWEKRNVKRIFHVASVLGIIADGATAKRQEMKKVTIKSLEAIEKRNQRLILSRYTSALLPMFGAGDGGLQVDETFPEIIKGIFEFFEKPDKPLLSSIFISAYSVDTRAYVVDSLDKNEKLERIDNVMR